MDGVSLARGFARYAAMAVLFGVLAYIGVELTRAESRIAAIWLPNAVIIAIMARRARFDLVLLLVVFAANVVSNTLGGDAPGRAAGLALANAVEIAVAFLGLRSAGLARPDMEDIRELMTFLFMGGVLAPATGALVAMAVLGIEGAAFFDVYAMWWLTDALSIVLITPCIWIFSDALAGRLNAEPRSAAEWSGILLSTAFVTAAVFLQSRYPLLFFVSPIMMICAFRLGSLGAAIAILIVAAISITLTASASGPVTLVQGRINEELVVLQAFLAANFAMSLPVTSILAHMRKANLALASSERRFQALSNLSPAGIFRTDAQGNATYVNRAWLAMAGVPHGIWESDSWTRALHPDDRAGADAAWVHAITTGGEFERDLRFVHADGTTVWGHALARPEIDENGAISAFIGVVFDITSSKRLVEELEVSQRKAQAATEAKSSFLANMSHEIRTPMNGVIGFTELLLDGPLESEQRQQVEMIAESGRIMLQLLNDILDISKIDTGNMHLADEAFDIRAKARSVLAAIQPLADAKSLACAVEIDESVPDFVRGDRLRVRQILLNLANNAVKFTAQGHVTMRISTRAGAGGEPCLVVAVEDTGIGIPAGRLDMIFGKFIQADSSVGRKYGGSGLGLAISRELALRMGGSLEVASVENEGSCFTLTLPLRTASAASVAHAAAAPAPTGPLRWSGARPPKVLVAEDNEINQALMRSIGRRSGITLAIAENGRVAIEMVEDAVRAGVPYDLLLMDMQMPELDGLSAARNLRASDYAHELPIIGLTANAFEEDIRACKAAGMQGHLAKPISLADFIQTLTTCIAGAGFQELPETTSVSGESAPAQTTPEDDGELAQLQAMYEWRKADLFARMAAQSSAGPPDAEALAGLLDDLHKFAGTAGFFGEGELGERAGALEHELQVVPAGERLALIRAAVAIWANTDQPATLH
ncbi:MASE1 domain-containing protein [Novosphingobium profundi]|uniref:ATP-binding protein n=1 Tax=Novosphingobium profundi TaxID=1774954 RepID=UPI001BD93B3D|nr:ATP-binding protein [Novosphingobium profundi]MBT0667937.1 MASE1 domain-containing protein [Novosphingobium profundi]